jgi:nucleoside phosphorylase
MTTYLYVKTGMENEYKIAKTNAAKNVCVLTGIQTVADLEKYTNAEAIISFGMYGGIGPGVVVGETNIASRLMGPNNEMYYPDKAWNNRIIMKIRAKAQPWYSTGKFNQSNTPEQRRTLWLISGALCMDDETLFVAQFAQKKGIPWVVCRNCSDAYLDNVAIASNLLNAGGGVDGWNVFKDFVTDPKDMIKMTYDYEISNAGLKKAAAELGPYFGWK